MVIKTLTCFFTDLKIYPGHGTQFVRRDGRLVNFLDAQSARLYHNGKKAARLTWTQTWRRNNKKVKAEVVQKRARKRRVRMQKAVGGLTIEEIRKRKATVPTLKPAKQTAAKEVKDRKKKETADKKSKSQAVPAPKMKFSKKGQR